MAFWSDNFAEQGNTLRDPKRKFRFLVNFSNLGADTQFMVSKAAKPSFELSNSTEHKILNHLYAFFL